MPGETVTPIVLFYDKRSFEKIGAEPPKSWQDIMNLVPKFNDKGIAPFSLGGQSRWTNMMWLEFLFDRIGGSEVFQNIYEGKANGWSDPSALKALEEMQNLIKANGFIKGFSSITADSNADQALLYTGKAAMMLHGAWTYGNMKAVWWRLRDRWAPRLHELPAVRRRQGRPERHRRQPGSVPVDLLQGEPGRQGHREEVPREQHPRRRLGRRLGEVGQHPGREEREGQALVDHRQERLRRG